MTALGRRKGRREAMSRVDTAWLRMEKPTNLMMITGVLMFAEPLELVRLRELIRDRFLAFHRFRQKAVDNQSSAHWEDDEDFDLDWHIRLTALPGAAGKKGCSVLSASWRRRHWITPSRSGSSTWWRPTTVDRR